MAAAARLSDDSRSIGKKALAAALNWSRPRLDRRLSEDSLFPVITRGDQTGGWAFDLVAVQAYLSGAPILQLAAADQPEPEEQGAAVAQFVAPARHQGEVTSRQLRDHADADLKIDRLRRIRGELTETADVKHVLSTVLVELRSGMLGMPDAIAKEFALDERVAFAMKARIEAMMRAAVKKIRQQLDVDAAPPADPA